MLLDLLTIILIIQAKNDLAARQFLKHLTFTSRPDGYPPTMDYPKVILLKAVAFTGGRQWLEGLF
jgi:hypothetical protein